MKLKKSNSLTAYNVSFPPHPKINIFFMYQFFMYLYIFLCIFLFCIKFFLLYIDTYIFILWHIFFPIPDHSQ